MNKTFILDYLKEEHLRGIESLEEICELSGIDVVKKLYSNHETIRAYVPMLQSNEGLMKEVIRANMEKKSIYELSSLTGLSRNKVKQLIKEIGDED